MKKRLFILLITTPFLLLSLSSDVSDPDIGLPAIDPSKQLIRRESYVLQYNEKFEQADWVAYELTREEVMGTVKRKDSFKPDELVETGSATLEDYKNSGYDRGHLAPAADMKISEQAMSDSFYMSNMSPQAPAFNRGIWSKLEGCVRTWAYQNEAVYVVTGPVLTKEEYSIIGENEVAVPEYYFKVILDYREPEIKAIAFILPNKKISEPLEEFAMTVDEAEELTGLDFFPALPDEIEEVIESAYDFVPTENKLTFVDQWEFKRFRRKD